MAGTEQGKQVRKYFLDCERVAKGKITTIELLQQINLLQSELKETIKIVNKNAKLLTEVKAFGHSTSCLVDRLLVRNSALDGELKRLNHPYGNYYTVAGYLNILSVDYIKHLSPNQVARVCKICTAYCDKHRIDVVNVHDMRYGTVGAYPETVISNCIPHEFYL